MKNTVTQAQIDELIECSEIKTMTVFNKATIMTCQLPNGFVLVETSSAIDPINYDQKFGESICLKHIIDKLWELEGYRLQEKLSVTNQIPDTWLESISECKAEGYGLSEAMADWSLNPEEEDDFAQAWLNFDRVN